ncbi:MAG: hypothetical protein ACWGSD_20020 [Thermodesulfobacteriota bacterium]
MLTAGCATEYVATGSMVMLSGGPPPYPKAVESVTLFIDPPERKFTAVAMVTASIRLDDFLDIAAAEAMVLEQLRREAATAGSDGVVDIQREVMYRGAVVISSSWKHSRGYGDRDEFVRYATRDESDILSLNRAYSLIFRGKAIRFSE